MTGAADAPVTLGVAPTNVLSALRHIPALTAATVRDVRRLGGMTNATWLVELDGRRVVVRLPSEIDDPVIDRDVEVANMRAAAAAGLAPPIVHADPGGLLVTPYVEGDVLDGATSSAGATIARVGRLLARLHRTDGHRFRGRFAAGRVLARYRDRLAANGAGLAADELALVRRAQRASDVLERSARATPCHHDPWPSNLIDTGDRLLLVDWEYSAVGDPLWDLAHFAVEADLGPDDTNRLLRAWVGGPPPPVLRDRLALWRPVTDVVWALWARVQHRGGNTTVDLRAYAARRLRRAARGLDDDLTDRLRRTA